MRTFWKFWLNFYLSRHIWSIWRPTLKFTEFAWFQYTVLVQLGWPYWPMKDEAYGIKNLFSWKASPKVFKTVSVTFLRQKLRNYGQVWFAFVFCVFLGHFVTKTVWIKKCMKKTPFLRNCQNKQNDSSWFAPKNVKYAPIIMIFLSEETSSLITSRNKILESYWQ